MAITRLTIVNMVFLTPRRTLMLVRNRAHLKPTFINSTTLWQLTPLSLTMWQTLPKLFLLRLQYRLLCRTHTNQSRFHCSELITYPHTRKDCASSSFTSSRHLGSLGPSQKSRLRTRFYQCGTTKKSLRIGVPARIVYLVSQLANRKREQGRRTIWPCCS